MIAIDGRLPIKHRVKQQEIRLEYLKNMDEELAGYTQGCLEGSGSLGGSAQGSLECRYGGAQLRRTYLQTLEKQRERGWRARTTPQQALLQGPTPPSLRDVIFG